MPVKAAEDMKPGDPIVGINVYADRSDPILEEKEKYPDWLWEMYREPPRNYEKLALIAEMTNSTADKEYMEPYPPFWEFTTLDNVQILDKRAKRAYTRQVCRLRAKHFKEMFHKGVYRIR